jgi:autotransporter translocation and assembly factor TamB
MLTGTVNADGPLSALKLGGSFQLAHGMLPLDWNGGAVREVGAQFTLDGNTIRVEQAAGRYVNGDFGIGGRLDLAKPRTPSIEAVGTGTYQSQPFTFSVKGDAMKPLITTEGHAPFSGNVSEPATKPAQ